MLRSGYVGRISWTFPVTAFKTLFGSLGWFINFMNRLRSWWEPSAPMWWKLRAVCRRRGAVKRSCTRCVKSRWRKHFYVDMSNTRKDSSSFFWENNSHSNSILLFRACNSDISTIQCGSPVQQVCIHVAAPCGHLVETQCFVKQVMNY